MSQPIRSMPELIAALRKRAQELQLTHQTIDEVSGMQSGYTSKLLAPVPIKNLGPMSFQSLLGTLGLAVVVVEDPEQIARISKQWTTRQVALRQKPTLSMPLSIENQVPTEIQITPELQQKIRDSSFMKSIGKLGGKRRLKTMGKRARQAAASHAARKRWGNRAC